MFKASGIDEAGLGSILGPFCVGGISLSSEENDPTFFQILASEITQKRGHQKDNEKIPVCDSKLLYKSGAGFYKLEEVVLAFSALQRGSIPENFEEFLSTHLFNSHPDELKKTPWFSELSNLKFPLVGSRENILSMKKRLEILFFETGTKLLKSSVIVVPAKQFNKALDESSNKADACRHIINPLLLQYLDKETNRIIVDHQGGRKDYSHWLLALRPGGQIRTFEQTKLRSCYQIEKTEMTFAVKADSAYFEVALASLFAKFTRECSMALFNKYWMEQYPELKRTAGYFVDGKRFIQDVGILDGLPKDIDTILRKL